MRIEVAPGQFVAYEKIPCSNAKTLVQIGRNELDAINGKPGSVVECMDALCALRLKSKFPHPVYWFEIARSKGFAVDKIYKDGTPKHVIRYNRSASDIRDTREFDRPGGKARMIRQGRVDKLISFLPGTSGSDRKTYPRDSTPKNKVGTGTKKDSVVRHGAWGRAKVAVAISVSED
jgi:hypothetical protein